MERVGEVGGFEPEAGMEGSAVATALKTIGDIAEERYLFPVEVSLDGRPQSNEHAIVLDEEELSEVLTLLRLERRGPFVLNDESRDLQIVHRSTIAPVEFVEHYYQQDDMVFVTNYFLRHK